MATTTTTTTMNPQIETVKEELTSHFDVDQKSLNHVGNLLLKLKELTFKTVFHDRVFSRDSAADSKKPVVISQAQPVTRPELTPYLFEGDIFLTEKQISDLLSHFNSKQRRSLSSDPNFLWKDFPIKYRFHDSMNIYSITQVIGALNYWQNHTCVRFQHMPEKPDGDYVEFFKGQGCYSMIGRYGGRQGISIGEGCERTGIIEHEVGHALGLWHEQSRPDSSDFIEVETDFILPSYTADFQTRTEKEVKTFGLPYDLGSVMHYGSTAFSTDGITKTLLTKDPNFQRTIGQREKLSFLDVQVINKAYCQDKCSENATDSAECANGGYPHPNKCSICICPQGYGGNDCSENEKSKNANCGKVLELTTDWEMIESPGYDDDGYVENQFCSWILKAPKKTRVEVEFIEDFGFLCSSTCLDYVELKLSKDQRNTGPRFCCSEKPNGTLISESSQMAVIFRSQAGQDVGFKLRTRLTKKKPVIPSKTETTTTMKPTTVAGRNILGEWGEWSQCSRPCGGCGIRSRVRICETAECDDKTQEFDTCNLEACPVNENCQKVFFLNRLCDSRVCTQLSDFVAECNTPTCCPPFTVSEGKCVGDDPILKTLEN